MVLSILRLLSLVATAGRLCSDLALEGLAFRQQCPVLRFLSYIRVALAEGKATARAVFTPMGLRWQLHRPGAAIDYVPLAGGDLRW